MMKAEELIAAIVEKLRANRDSLAKAATGRVTWRKTSKGTIEVKVQPDL